VRAGLRPEQIRATLVRHGYPDNLEVLGIRYEPDQVVVVTEVGQLLVPDDVLALEPDAREPKRRGRRRLFEREIRT
jgi:hypothetical protein